MTGYKQLPSGFWVRDDGSGPYFVDVETEEARAIGEVANFATVPEAQAGVATTVVMSPYLVTEEITARLSTLVQAQTGTDNVTLMTPLRVANAIGAISPGYRGLKTTVADVQAITSPATGDQAVLSDANLPFPIVCVYTGSAWRAAGPLYIQIADHVAGTTSASEQCAAGWIKHLTTGLLQLYRRMDLLVYGSKSGSTNNFGALTVRLGTNSNGTDNTAILTTAGSYVAAASNSRSAMFVFYLSSTATVRQLGTDAQSGAASGIQLSNADTGAVTLGGGDTFASGLYFSTSATMNGTTDTPTLSTMLVLHP